MDNEGSSFGVGAIAYLIAIFGSEGLIQLLLGAYGPIAQLAPAVYASLFFRKVSAISIIIGLILGVCITIYYQYFAESTLCDLHAGLIGLVFNVTAVFIFSYIYKQSDREIVKAKEFNEI